MRSFPICDWIIRRKEPQSNPFRMAGNDSEEWLVESEESRDRHVQHLVDLGTDVIRVRPRHKALACSRNSPLFTLHCLHPSPLHISLHLSGGFTLHLLETPGLSSGTGRLETGAGSGAIRESPDHRFIDLDSQSRGLRNDQFSLVDPQGSVEHLLGQPKGISAGPAFAGVLRPLHPTHQVGSETTGQLGQSRCFQRIRKPSDGHAPAKRLHLPQDPVTVDQSPKMQHVQLQDVRPILSCQVPPSFQGGLATPSRDGNRTVLQQLPKPPPCPPGPPALQPTRGGWEPPPAATAPSPPTRSAPRARPWRPP